ncbi:MAG: efflux RND transporter periplasmic adaptor subunit, partial [Thermoanaerobaculia bacterium]
MKTLTTCSALLLILVAAGCEKPAEKTETAAKPNANAMRNVHTETVALQSFRKTIAATGTVAFNQNKSTQVLSPISGPLARILVNVGNRVIRDQALAVVSSPDFAAAISAVRKAEATAKNTRRIATLDEQLFKNDAIARRDLEQAQTDAINAEADLDAAVQQLRSLGVDSKT